MKPAQYLGDGVYAAVNDYDQIVLTTGDDNERNADNVIYLEPEVWRALQAFLTP